MRSWLILTGRGRVENKYPNPFAVPIATVAVQPCWKEMEKTASKSIHYIIWRHILLEENILDTISVLHFLLLLFQLIKWVILVKAKTWSNFQQL